MIKYCPLCSKEIQVTNHTWKSICPGCGKNVEAIDKPKGEK